MTADATRLGRRLALLFVVLLVVLSAVRASRSRHVGGDFLRYHRAGRLVATGRAELVYDKAFLRKQSVYAEERAADRAVRGDRADDFQEFEFKYDPVFAVLMAPLGSLPPRPAWILWGAWNGLMLGLTFVAAWSLTRLSWKWAPLPFLVLLHKTNANLNLGQVNPTAICGLTTALWMFLRGPRPVSVLGAAAAAGLGSSVKYLPTLFYVPFAGVRRAWGALVAGIAAPVVFFLALPAAVLGPERFATLFAEHKAQRAAVYAGVAAPDLPGHSIKSFVYRVFGGTHYITGQDEDRVDMDVSLVELPDRALFWIVLVLSVAVLVWALVAGRPAARRRDDAASPAGDVPAGVPGGSHGAFLDVLGAALVVTALPLASPEARSPHFSYLTLPLFALTAGLLRAWRMGYACRRTATALAVVAALLLQTDSESLLRGAAHVFSAWCALGWATAAVFAALVLLAAEERRRA